MRLDLMTSPEVDAYLARRRSIIVPVGATEQHGPKGLIGTDHLAPEAIARASGAAYGILVGPTLTLGQSQHHLAFAGTISLRPSTFVLVIGDLIASLARHGFERVLLLNGHGGNVAPLRVAIKEQLAAHSVAGGPASLLHVRARNWWDLPGVARLRRELYGAQEGSHATPSEIAVTMASHPEAIPEFELPPPEEPRSGTLEQAGDGSFDADDYRRRYPDGRMGSHSALARRADGERLIALAVDDLAREVEAFEQAS